MSYQRTLATMPVSTVTPTILRKRFGMMNLNQLGGVPFDWLNPSPTNPGTTPPFVPSGSGNSTVNQITNAVRNQTRWDLVTGLVSQGIAAFGKNQTQQIAGLTIRPLQTQQTQQYSGYGNAGLTPEQAYYANVQQRTNTTGGALGGGFDGIVNWVTANPLIVILVIGGVILYKSEPAKRR